MAVMDIIIRAVDKASNVIDKMAKKNNAAFDSMAKKWKAAEGSLLTIGGSMLIAGGAITLISGKLIKMASDAEETGTKFAVVFQDVSAEAERTAKNLSRNFGMSSASAKQLLGDTGDLLTGFGFTGEAALDLASQVNELAVDLASFTNYSGGAKGASQALTKALLGERESVKLLGISILEEDVKAKVALLTKEGMTFETERQAKAYATLLIAQEQSKNAIGDFARTQEGFANQTRILNERISELGVELGNKLLPIATKLINVVVTIVEKITDWTQRHPVLTGIIIKFGAALGLLVGTGGALILGALAFVRISGAVKESIGVFSSLIKVMPMVITKILAFNMAVLANPLVLWITAIIAVITAIVLLYKNWDKVTKFISDKIDWITEKFKWLGDKIKWVAEKLGLYKEKTIEASDSTGTLKESIDEVEESIDQMKETTEEAVTATDGLGTSLETVAEKARLATDDIIIYAEGIAENYIQLAGRATDSWADFYAFWEAEAARTAKKVEETIEAPEKKKSNLYKVIDAKGNIIRLQSGTTISQQEKEEGYTVVKLHKGGIFRAPTPGGEGLALLKDQEIVTEPGKAIGNEITVIIQSGAVQIRANYLTDEVIDNSGKKLFDKFVEEMTAHNVAFGGA